MYLHVFTCQSGICNPVDSESYWSIDNRSALPPLPPHNFSSYSTAEYTERDTAQRTYLYLMMVLVWTEYLIWISIYSSYACVFKNSLLNFYMKKNISGGTRQATCYISNPWTALFRAYLYLSNTPPVYIRRAHQNTSGSAGYIWYLVLLY